MTLNTDISFHSTAAGKSAGARHSARALTATTSFCVQRFSGDIDLQTVADFAAALDRVLAQRPECLVLDLSQVNFLSASGLSELSRFCTDAARAHVSVAVVGSRAVSRPIEVCRLETTPALYDTVDDAGAALGTLLRKR